jgi:hypothetical protein
MKPILIEKDINNLDEETEQFLVKFNHLISPEILLSTENPGSVKVKGTVKIAIDKMLDDFTRGLGLKTVIDKLVKKTAGPEGYFLDIKGIARASLSVRQGVLLVMAEYGPAKEWWAKPIALVVLGKLLGDFATNVENCGISPGFRNDIKQAMQQLRKNNLAVLELKNLFQSQTYYTENNKVSLISFEFNSVKTLSENGDFVIDFAGRSIAKSEPRLRPKSV